jgi:anti-anti-sigma regulatory factor
MHEEEQSLTLKLEGRIAGPWVAELHNAWLDAGPRLGKRTLVIDLTDVIYADELGKQVLKLIHARTRTEFVTSTPWTQYLAEEVTANHRDHAEGAKHAGNE